MASEKIVEALEIDSFRTIRCSRFPRRGGARQTARSAGLSPTGRSSPAGPHPPRVTTVSGRHRGGASTSGHRSPRRDFPCGTTAGTPRPVTEMRVRHVLRPMEGVRVLEVAQFTYVPAAGAVLADWGADVVKIEHA